MADNRQSGSKATFIWSNLNVERFFVKGGEPGENSLVREENQ